MQNNMPAFVKAKIESMPVEKLNSLLGGEEAIPWRELPSTQAQIKKVFAVARDLGYTGKEAVETFDFLHMTRGEISDLINELEGKEPQVRDDDDGFPNLPPFNLGNEKKSEFGAFPSWKDINEKMSGS